MASKMEVLLLEKCGSYAYNNSIASDSDTARVVDLWDLKRHLYMAYPAAYNRLVQNHHSLEDFLRITGRDIVRSGAIQSWREWNYEIMSLPSYLKDKRHQHHCFSSLQRHPNSRNSTLFVFYLKEEKQRYEAERAFANRNISEGQLSIPTMQTQSPTQNKGGQTRIEREVHDNTKRSTNLVQMARYLQDLSEEINDLCQSLTPTQKEMDDVKNVKNRIQAMINQVWPGHNYQVVLFGSSANSLALRGADADLCIIVPPEVYEQDLHRYRLRLSKQPKTVYNMFYLAARLKDMGMSNIEAIGSAQVPICKFVDPQTGYHCDINTNNVLGIENSELIKEYCSLDSRIRPLIFAIKYFVKQKNINNPRGGTLSSYTYVIMILHFLMKVLPKPVIPSLQETPQRCSFRNCRFNYSRPVSLLQDHQIMKWNSRYHDCLYIDNVKTQKFGLQYQNNGTRWEGHNKDSLGLLLCSFFRHFSNKENFQFSIISASGAIKQVQSIQSTNCPFIIQDPFIHTKNVARSCTDIGARVITQEFERAAKLLSDGSHTFEEICKSTSNIPRPVDTQSLEFRFQQQKTVKTQQKQSNGQQVETVRQEDKVVHVSKNEINELAKSFGIFHNSDEKPDIPAASNKISITKPSNNSRKEDRAEYIGVMEPANETRGFNAQVEDRTEFCGFMEFVYDEEGSDSRSDNITNDLKTSSNTNSSTSQEVTDVKPILNLIQTLMEHKPSNGYNTPVELYTSKPCTDMSKLLESSAVKDISAKDICYLIAQLNFLGDALAEKLTASTNPTTNSVPINSQFQGLSTNENDYVQELQNMFYGIELDDSTENYDPDEDVYDDEEDEEELLIIRPGKSKYIEYDAGDIVTIEYYVTDSPDNHIEEYELYSILQWYGKVKEFQYLDDVFTVWRVTMDILYGKLKTLPAKLDVGYDRLKAYAAIVD